MEVIFIYEGFNTIIQCKEDEKMKKIIDRFLIKINPSNTNLFYIYNGTKINFDLTFNEQANDIDKNRKKMNVIVTKRDEEKKGINEIISKDIICPECRRNILLKIKNYKINLYGCKYDHSQENILLNLFEESQKINLNEIICGFCHQNNKKNTHNNQFYICNTCKKYICPLCQSVHDKNHRIMNYNDKNYMCRNHNESFIKFCENCCENICILCEKNHKKHNLIDLSKMILDKNDLLKNIQNLKETFDKFKYKINAIKEVLNNMSLIFDLYYKINQNLFENYNINKRNFYGLKNMNYLKQNNEALINELNNVIKENKIYEYSLEHFYNEYGEKYFGDIKKGIKEGKGIFYYKKEDKYLRKKYEGEFKNDLPEGKGIMYWNNGDKYEGDFKNGVKEGKGIKYYQNGNKYEGDWKNDKKEGKGKMIYDNGDIYDGFWKNNKCEGKGIFQTKIGDKYEGDFKNNKFEGKGIYFCKNGDKYEGDFKNNKFEGKGKMTFNIIETYEGDFKNGLKEGEGILHDKKGDTYKGPFKNNIREGKGIKIYKNGNKYEGDFKNDVREGKGIEKYSNGDIYKGDFKSDVREGKGTYIHNNGIKYVGDFKGGKKEGLGIEYHPDGTRYEGEFKNGIREGFGMIYYNNGTKAEGQWKNNIFITNKYK